ncbi:AIPR family protein [Orbus sturtevantii]|uniref:AIPR family protein n=1 Tax=Orbus sturtevantii TaxID=3074109 RepID=UPI00370D7F53
MNIMLDSYFRNFIGNNQFEDYSDNENFEKFCNYYLINQYYPQDFDLERCSIGGGDDFGIDGLCIIVDDICIHNKDDLKSLYGSPKKIDVKFIFNQIKNSEKFDLGDILKFLSGVKIFYENETQYTNEDLKNYYEIKNNIYKNIIKFHRPEIILNYVTTGKWQEPEEIIMRIKSIQKDLEELNIGNICTNFIDSKKIESIHNEVENKIEKQIDFRASLTLPKINDVRQSHILSVPINEFIKLITNDTGNILKNLFLDNVRDFQGSNSVNEGIKKTITSELQEALPMFNNGITIIAKHLEIINQRIVLTDFQIVNGCQTSHVIWENRESLKNNTDIIVKVIETTSSELSESIIKATNKQTEVKDEAFESLSDFHKGLENYFNAYATKRLSPIYYERRSKQYQSDQTKKPHQIINLSKLTRASVACILYQPQSTHRYYGELLNSNRDKIFKKEDSNYSKYYLAASISNKVDSYLRKKEFSSYKLMKDQLSLIIYKKMEANKKIQDQLYQIIDSTKDFRRILAEAIEILVKLSGNDKSKYRVLSRSKDFTTLITESLVGLTQKK